MALKIPGFKGLFRARKDTDITNPRVSQIVQDEMGEVTSMFPVGSTIDTGITPSSTSLTIPTQTELQGEYMGSRVSYSWMNHSGATDDFTYTVENTTKSLTIMSEALTGIPNNTAINDAAFITSDKHDIGDTIRLRHTAGVLGTAEGETILGYVILRIQNFIKVEGIIVDEIQYGKVQV